MQLSYSLIRSRRKTISLEIMGSGQVLVRAPLRIPDEEIQQFIQQKSSWLERHLEKRKEEQAALRAEGNLTKEDVEKLVSLAKQIIPEKVSYYARLMNVTYGQITIRRQKSRWGSCSQKGNLNFNCLLMMTPPEVLDYVVVHELCHRLEMNHSVRFWEQVEKMLPDYKKQRKWLKEHGGKLMIRMHGEE